MPLEFNPDNEQRKFLEFVANVGLYPLYKVKNYLTGMSAVGCLEYDSEDQAIFLSQYGKRNVMIEKSYAVKENLLCKNDQVSISRIELFQTKGSSLTYNLEVPTKSLMITDQVHSDAWIGTIDGQQIPAQQVDGYRLGYIVPANSKELKIIYSPRSFKLGKLLTIIGTLIVLLVYIMPLFFRRYLITLNSLKKKPTITIK